MKIIPKKKKKQLFNMLLIRLYEIEAEKESRPSNATYAATDPA